MIYTLQCKINRDRPGELDEDIEYQGVVVFAIYVLRMSVCIRIPPLNQSRKKEEA